MNENGIENETISIIVCYYQGEKYLDNILGMYMRNKLNLTGLSVNTELIIINDSPWEKIEIPGQYQEHDIRVVDNEQNLGIHGSRVKGIEVSKGDYVLLLDQDDMVSDTYLISQYTKLKSGDMIICNGTKELENKNKRIYKDCIKFSLINHPIIYLCAANQIVSPGQCLMRKSAIPKEWIENVMTTNGSDDLFLWLLYLARGNKFKKNKDALYCHKQVGSNLSNDMKKMCESDFEMCEIAKKSNCLPAKYLNKRIRMCRFIECTDYSQKIRFKTFIKFPDICILKIFAYFI